MSCGVAITAAQYVWDVGGGVGRFGVVRARARMGWFSSVAWVSRRLASPFRLPLKPCGLFFFLAAFFSFVLRPTVLSRLFFRAAPHLLPTRVGRKNQSQAVRVNAVCFFPLYCLSPRGAFVCCAAGESRERAQSSGMHMVAVVALLCFQKSTSDSALLLSARPHGAED